MTDTTSTDEAKACLNCDHPIQTAEKFCAKCGQKQTDGRVRFFSLLKDFLGDTFSFDSRLAKSILPLFFKPGELTKQYFLGKHKSYVSPVRLFLFSIIFFFGLVALKLGEDGGIHLGNDSSQKEQFNKKLYHNELVAKVDTARITFKEQISDPEVHAVLDTTFTKALIPKDVADSTDFTMANFWGNEIGIKVSSKDLYNLTAEEIMDKYGMEGFWKRIFFGKTLKIMQDGESFFKFAISRMSWMVFLMMPFIAFALKLLYIRRKKYYVEHFVFSMHIHSLAFILFGIVILISPYIHDAVSGMVFLVLYVYSFIAMRRFYGQGKTKTFFKQLFLLFSYLIIFIFGVLGLLAISLLIY